MILHSYQRHVLRDIFLFPVCDVIDALCLVHPFAFHITHRKETTCWQPCVCVCIDDRLMAFDKMAAWMSGHVIWLSLDVFPDLFMR